MKKQIGNTIAIFLFIVITIIMIYIGGCSSDNAPSPTPTPTQDPNPTWDPPPFPMSGEGSSENAACIDADNNANSLCPYGANRIKAELEWETPIFSEFHWSCMAEYKCKSKK